MSEAITAMAAMKRLDVLNRFLAQLKKVSAADRIIVDVRSAQDLSVLSLALQTDHVVVQSGEDDADPAAIFVERFCRNEVSETAGEDVARSIRICFDASAEIERTPDTITVVARIAAAGVFDSVRPSDDFVTFRLVDAGVDLACFVAGLEPGMIARLAGDAGAALGGEIRLTFGVNVSEPVIRIPPHRFIHDGHYRAERDGDFRWLWSGPDPHFRLFLGAVPFRPAEISLVFVAEGVAGNLRRLRTLVNGVVCDARIETWAGGAGRMSLDIGPDVADPIVVSIAAHEMKTAEDRKLGVCVGMLEIRGRQ